jgi:hypothetical protein
MTTLNHPSNELLRLARRIYQEFKACGLEFNIADVRTAVRCAVDDSLNAQVIDFACDKAVDHVDAEETGPQRPAHHQPFLPGFDTEGSMALGKGRRIGKADAQFDHEVEWLNLSEKNVLDAEAAHQRKVEEFEKLKPYWRTGMTKREAIAAYLAAQSDAG